MITNHNCDDPSINLGKLTRSTVSRGERVSFPRLVRRHNHNKL